MPVIKSILKAGVDALADTSVKGKAVPNLLKKAGVKDEELKFADLGLEPDTRYSSEELVEKVGDPTKDFKTVTARGDYSDYSTAPPEAKNSYREKVTTFSQNKSGRLTVDDRKVLRNITRTTAKGEELDKEITEARKVWAKYSNEEMNFENTRQFLEGKPPSRYTSEHFPDVKDYLLHTRVYDDAWDGKSTRVIEEIQSDLHQQGRQRGYKSGIKPTKDELAVVDTWLLEAAEASDELSGKADSVLRSYGLSTEAEDYEAVLDFVNTGATGQPLESPFEKTWLRKGMEREIADALNNGAEQIAIPISGNVGSLHRGEGVQKWYETKVQSTAKKLAKSMGADFEIVNRGHLLHINAFDEAFRTLERAQGVEQKTAAMRLIQMIEENELPNDTDFFYNLELIGQGQEIKSTILSSDYNAFIDGSGTTKYAVIKPKGRATTVSQEAEDLMVNKQAAIEEIELKIEALADANNGDPKGAVWNELTEQRSILEDEIAELENVGTAVPVRKFIPEEKSFSLYSSPIAGGFATYAAYKEGYSEEEVRAKLVADGHDEEEIEETLAKATQIQEAIAQGYSEEEVRAHMMGNQPSVLDVTSTPKAEKTWWEQELEEFESMQERADVLELIGTGQVPGVTMEDRWDEAKVSAGLVQRAYKRIVGLDPEMSLEDFTASLELIAPNMTSVLTRTSAFAGNDEARRTAEQAQVAAREMRIKFAKDLGIELVWQGPGEGERSDIGAITDTGQWMARTVDGSLVPAEAGFWATLRAEKGEIGFSIAGGIIGAQQGSQRTPGPAWAKFIGGGLGSMLGAMGGGALGTQLDYLESSIKLDAELDATIAWHKSTTAMEASALGDLIGYPLAKLGIKGWHAVKAMKEAIKNSDILGAKRALKEVMILTDDEIDHIVTQTARVMELPSNSPGKEVVAFITTQPGGEEIMREVGTISPTASRNVSKAIDARAKDLAKTSSELTSPDAVNLVKQDLDNYVTDVKQFYGAVKRQAQEAPGTNKFSFNFDKLAIDPTLKELALKITDPAAVERYLKKAELISDRVDGRTFTDLLDLRQLVNEFRYGRGNKKAVDHKLFKSLMTRIDDEIKEGAQSVFENPKAWLDDFATARIDYSKMKALEKNVLFKLLTRKGVKDETVVNGLTKYISVADETWSDVMNQLPKTARTTVEGATVHALVNKHTMGEGFEAINFPTLSNELENITFTTPDARALKASIGELARVFKNDVQIAKRTGTITMPTVNQGLTDNPVIKAKYSFMAKLWTQSQKFFPGKDGRHAAMLAKAAKMLANPLNVKASRELMDELGSATTMAGEILEVQKQAALEAANDTSGLVVKLYGEGSLLSPKGSGAVTRVHLSRIATHDIIQQVMTDEAIHKGDSAALTRALKQRGYTAMASGTEKVKVL